MNEPQQTSRPLSRTAVLIITFAVFAVVSGLSILALQYYLNAKQLYLQLNRERQALATASIFRYGTVESVHPEASVVVLQVSQLFSPEQFQRISIQITPETNIARQDMQEENGVYVSLSPLAPAAITDVRPGSRAAVLVGNQGQSERITALTFIFGTPL